MPKMKTKSAAKKRFFPTARGKVKVKPAKTSHMMMNKPTAMKRNARSTTILSEADSKVVLRHFLPYGKRGRKAKAASADTPANTKEA